MKRGRARSTGTLLATAATSLSAAYFIVAGLLVYLMPSVPIPGGLPAMVGYEVVGFALLTLAAGLFTMVRWCRTPATVASGLLMLAFAYLGVTTFTVAEPATVVNVLMAVNNGMAAVALLLSDDIVVSGRTDTSEQHATDIGTGWR